MSRREQLAEAFEWFGWALIARDEYPGGASLPAWVKWVIYAEGPQGDEVAHCADLNACRAVLNEEAIERQRPRFTIKTEAIAVARP